MVLQLADCRFPFLSSPWAEALPEAVEWILENLPVRAILAGGSPVRGDPDPASDLDLQIIIGEDWMQRLTRFFHGVPCEIFANPLHQYQRWFQDEAREGRPSTAHMIATAAVLLDPEGLCPGLQADAARWLEQPPEVHATALQRARYAPATDVEDAQDVLGRDPGLSALFVAEALPRALEAYLLAHGMPLPRRKERLATLERLDPAAAAALRRCLAATTPEERMSTAAAACRILVGASGTFAWESGRIPVPGPRPGPWMAPLDLGGGLSLRPSAETDAEEIFAIVDAQRERLGRFLPFVADTRSVEDVRSFERDRAEEVRAGRRVSLTIWVEDRPVGRIVLKNVIIAGQGPVPGIFGRISAVASSAEIGYWLSLAVEGRGVMTRVLAAVCDRAFQVGGAGRLTLWTHPENLRSQAVAVRCGFVREGLSRQSVLLAGQPVDQVLFARLAGDPVPGIG